MFEFPTIHIAGILILEPVTALTDVILCLLAFALAARVSSRLHTSFYNDAWRMFFFFIGLSTGIGALAHGLAAYMSDAVYHGVWMAMNIAAGISVYFALAATIRFSRISGKTRQWIRRANTAILFIFLGLTLWFNNFEIFKIHAGLGVISIFATFFSSWYRNYIGSGAVMLAFGLSIGTVFIHTYQFTIDTWFNYKDLSHVMMMASLLLVYRGIELSSNSLRLSYRRMME